MKKQVLRLTAYKRALLKMRSLGFQKVFSDNLAEAAGVSAALVRKDFSQLRIPGNRRGGYDLSVLLGHLETILGNHGEEAVILVGAGNLGRALIRRKSFSGERIRIVAAFDSDPARHNPGAETPVLPVETMADYIRNRGIRIAIMTVPEQGARDVYETLLGCRIAGILNFAPVSLASTERCWVNNINLGLELEAVLYFVANKEDPDHE